MINYIRGYYVLIVEGIDAEKYLNFICKSRISIYNVKRISNTKIEFCGLKSHIREPEFVITFRKLVITCFPVRAGCSTFVETGICPFNRRASGE